MPSLVQRTELLMQGTVSRSRFLALSLSLSLIEWGKSTCSLFLETLRSCEFHGVFSTVMSSISRNLVKVKVEEFLWTTLCLFVLFHSLLNFLLLYLSLSLLWSLSLSLPVLHLVHHIHSMFLTFLSSPQISASLYLSFFRWLSVSHLLSCHVLKEQ